MTSLDSELKRSKVKTRDCQRITLGCIFPPISRMHGHILHNFHYFVHIVLTHSEVLQQCSLQSSNSPTTKPPQVAVA